MKNLKYLLLASVIWMSGLPSLFALESSWIYDGASIWTGGTNWDNGVPGTNGTAGDIANLTYDISANRNITLTTNVILGVLNIGDPSGNARYMPTPVTYGITFDNSGAGAWLHKPFGLATGNGDEIDCKVALADNLTISNSGPVVFWKYPITGLAGNSLAKIGPGMVQVDYRGNNTYGGGTIIAGGLFQTGGGSTGGATFAPFGSGSVTVSNGATVLLCKTGGTGNHVYTTNNYVFGAGGGAIYGYEGNNHLTGPITVSEPAKFGSSFGGKAIYLDGPISGAANVTLTVNTNYGFGNNWNGSFVHITNDASSSYSGTVTVTPMTSGNGSYLFIGGANALSGATINLAGNNATANGVTGVNNFANTLQFTVSSATIGALSGSGSFSLTKTDGSTAVALTVGNNNASTALSGTISGSGSLTKIGTGELTISSANYTGTTTVSAGKLGVSAASTATNTITVADGAAFRVNSSGTSQLAPSTLTLGSSTGATNEFGGLSSTTVAPLKPGTLVANGICKISVVSGAFVAGGSYPLITNSSVGSVTFSLANQPVGVSGNLSTSGNTLYYNVTSVTPKIWSGATDANWDMATVNWTFNSSPTTYQNDNSVLFDDTGVNATITIPAAVSPGSVTVSNSSQTYSFSGAAISGAASLTKTGDGTLTLNNTNTFTGGVAVNGGTLNVSGNNAYAGGTVVNNSGTLTLSAGGLVGAIRGTLTANAGGYVNCAAGNSLGYGSGTRVETVNVNGGLVETTVAGDQGWNTTFNLTGGELRANGGVSSSASITYFALGKDGGGSDGINTFASAASSVISGRLHLRNDNGQTSVTFNVADGAAAVDLLVSAAITYNAGTVGITKTGAGTMELTGANTYTGSTIVNAGTLLVDGSTGAGGVTVTNATLGGFGTISGPVAMGDNATLAPGVSGYGVLTVSSLTNSASSTNLITLRKTGGVTTNGSLVVSGALAYDGTLIVTTNAGDDALALGDSFQVFTAGSSSGAFAATTLPATPSGTTWDFAGGKLTVVALNAASMPTFNPGSGGYIGAQQVTISSATAGSTINYSLDGSTWSSGANPVVVTVPVNTNLTLFAYATKSGYTASATNSATYATLDHGTWISTGGSWPVSGNWSNGVVAAGSGVTADFATVALTTTNFVTLDGARTVGMLLFNDLNNTFPYVLSTTGPLTLDASNNTPIISVGLDSDAYGWNNSAILSCAVAGTNGFAKTGPGNLILGNNGNSFTGNLTVSNGTLTVRVGTSSGSANSALGAKVAGRSVVIKSYALWTANNIFGGSGLNATNLPALVVSGGTNDATRWNPLGDVVLNGGTLNQDSTDGPGSYEGWQFLGKVSVTGSAPSFITAGGLGKADHLLNSGNTFDVADVTGNPDSDLIVSAILKNSSGDYSPTTTGSLFKTGAGTLELAAANTYVGSTVVSNGNLLVSGSIASGGTVTVLTNGTLSGSGTIYSPVTVQYGGTLQPGTTNMGTLSISSTTLSLGGNASFRISKNGGTPATDLVSGLSSVSYGGTLTVTDVTSDSTPLANGDSFQLFQASSYGVTLFTNYVLPTLAGGLSWDKSQLNANGIISVVNTTATPLFSPAAGVYFNALSVSIIGDTGSTIHYSTNGGSTWSTAATPATVNIPMNANVTITAYASKSGYSDSAQVSATYITQPEAVWTSTADGSWAGNYNWLNNAIGNGSGVTADFNTLTLTANTTVSLDSTPTIGNLKFGDNGSAYNWNITSGTGGPLTLDAGATVPSITVSNMTASFTNVLAGTNGLVKNGAGTLVLAGLNTYTGNTVVSNGTLVLAAGGSTGAIRGKLTIESGKTVILSTGDALGYGSPAVSVTNIVINGGLLTNSTTANQGIITSFDLTGGTMAGGGGNGYNMANGYYIASHASSTKSLITSVLQLRSTSTNVINVAAGSVPDGTDLEISGNIYENTGPNSAITKTGPGKLVLGGYNSYNGPTTISNGTLIVNGWLASANSGVFMYGGTLGGSGTINGQVTVNAGCTLSPGNTNIGKLTINNNLSLAGTAAFRLNKSGSVLTNDSVAGLTNVIYGGTLTVTASGDALAGGDAFTLFSSTARSGSFAATNLPSLGSGKVWQWNPTNGTLSVIATVNTTPTNIVTWVSGNQLTLSWPADHTGWILQSQTNNLSAGLSGTWYPVSGSTTTNQMTVDIDPANPTVFYRLFYQP